MLPRVNRLTGKSNFDKVLKGGEILHTPSLGLVVFREGGDMPSRVGFIISNKISKKAVVRNRVRRILREAVRENLLLLPKGVIFIFLAKRGIIDRSVEEISGEVKRSLLHPAPRND